MPRAARSSRGKGPSRPLQDSINHESIGAYQDLLHEDVRSHQPDDRPLKRPAKRRKVAKEQDLEQPSATSDLQSSLPGQPDEDRGFAAVPSDHGQDSEQPREPQVIYTSSESSAESDVDWETLLGDTTKDQKQTPKNRETQNEQISVNIGEKHPPKHRSIPSKRLPSSRVDKQKRLEVHKIHLCCLLAHTFIRSAWCNELEVQVG